MGAFVYAVTAADVVRLLRLRKRLQRSLSFVYAGMYPICAGTLEVLLWMLCLQYCVNEYTQCKYSLIICIRMINSNVKMNFIKVKNEKGEEQLLEIDPAKVKIIHNFNNRQAFHPIDLNTIATTSESLFTIVPSSFAHSHPVNNMEKLLVKTETSSPSVENVSKENWTDAEIQLLLEQRLSMNDKFENPNSRKTPYWNLIVKAFEEKGYKVKVQDLMNKWKNLLVTYNRNASKLKKTGESAITWKYFQQMHECFATKKSVNPPEKLLGSTFKPETLTLKDELILKDELTDDTDASTENCTEAKRRKKNLPKKKKTQFQEEMLRIVEEKKSQALKLKIEMWEDKKKIAKSKIEAINNLATILKDIQKNRTTYND
ncbi:uncharacterized protein [Linepithema humile]|uniref:uncharacterized protein n=1 Tax=Linepithema humile TaxID=83485 RepID=UPI00351EE67C